MNGTSSISEILVALSVVLFVSSSLLGQERLYVNNSLENCKKSKATHYKLVTESEKLYSVELYDMMSHLKMKGTSLDSMGNMFHGDFEFYHRNGIIESRGKYFEGSKVGLWERYSSQGKALAERNYAAFDTSRMAYLFVDEMPYFEGGKETFRTFLKQRLRPLVEEAVKGGKTPEIEFSFIVTQRGLIEELEITHGIDPYWDTAALELLQNLPRWMPGKNKGEEVRVWIKVPMELSL